MPAKLRRAFYARETLDVARELIGMHLVFSADGAYKRARIVETEAYKGPDDLAAHSARGRTPRNEVMFGPPGHTYVYLIYGIWHCLNFVTAETGTPHAVLIRALEPLDDIAESTWGPGLLCRALGIDRSHNGLDLCGERIWLERPDRFRAPSVSCAPRIGVDYAGDWAQRPWRFFDSESPYVSHLTTGQRRKRLAPAVHN